MCSSRAGPDGGQEGASRSLPVGSGLGLSSAIGAFADDPHQLVNAFPHIAALSVPSCKVALQRDRRDTALAQ